MPDLAAFDHAMVLRRRRDAIEVVLANRADLTSGEQTALRDALLEHIPELWRPGVWRDLCATYDRLNTFEIHGSAAEAGLACLNHATARGVLTDQYEHLIRHACGRKEGDQ